MGMRPPTDDGIDADTVEFGIVAFDGLLDEATVEFPADRADLREALGDRTVAVDPSGREVAVDDVLADLDDRRYESPSDLKEALHPIFEDRRSGLGLVGTVRSWLGL